MIFATPHKSSKFQSSRLFIIFRPVDSPAFRSPDGRNMAVVVLYPRGCISPFISDPAGMVLMYTRVYIQRSLSPFISDPVQFDFVNRQVNLTP
jgi:hypothetical protein